ncbi:hypothetical protein K3495_g6032 [Podosphaera aphanis]|nr:hypothetical protein K3495_g6032 [Podosphaera aphanis]
MSSITQPIVPAVPAVPTSTGIPPPSSQPARAAISNSGVSADARNKAPAPPRNKKEPRQFATPSAATISSVSPMLLGVRNLPFYTNQRLSTNNFVLSSITFFAILAELDANMSNTHRFFQSAPN